MKYLYMITQYPLNLVKTAKDTLAKDADMIANEAFPEASGIPVQPLVFTGTKRESLFRIMRRVYQFLDDWRASGSDTPILLSVDPETAKIVNSYFCEMSDSEYEHFSVREGEVLRYRI